MPMFWFNNDINITARCIQDNNVVRISIDIRYQEDINYVKNSLIEMHDKDIAEEMARENKSANKVTVGNII